MPDVASANAELMAEALFDYDGLTQEELTFEQGEQFRILQHDDQDWLYVRRLDVEPSMESNIVMEGFVPRSFMKYDKNVAAPLPSAVTEPSSPGTRRTSVSEGASRAGSPTSDLETDGREVAPKTPTRRLSSIVKGKMKLDVHKVLAAFGAMPDGFRPSVLAEYRNTSRLARLSHSLLPKFEAHGLGFIDMKPITSTADQNTLMQPMKTLGSLAFSVVEAKHVPLPGNENTIVGRYMNVCLFNKSNYLSNVQTIHAQANMKNLRQWKFSHKNSFLFPSDDENSLIIRADQAGPDICVLFELVLVISKKRSDSNGLETKDVSCGWGVLPVFGIDGKVLESKSYEVKLFGGTPYEKDVALEDLPALTPSKSKWQVLKPSTRTPMLTIKVWKLGGKIVEELDYLPPSISCLLSSVTVLALVRKTLFSLLVRQKDVPDLKSVSSPFLKLALKICDQPDLLKSLTALWETNWNKLRRTERKDAKKVEAAFLETVAAYWPAFTSTLMPICKIGQQGRSDDRNLLLTHWLSDGPVKSFTASVNTMFYKPFSVDECAYSHISQLVSNE